jgi:O-antigen ligase
MLLADLLTFSRGGYLGIFIGAVVTFLFLFNKISKKHGVRILGFVIFLSSSLIIPGPISERFFSSFNFKEGSNQGRIETWKKAGEVILNHPLFGVGIGNYPLEISATANYRDPIYAHSNYLDIAAETGLINLFLWLGFSGSLVFVFLARAQDVLFLSALLSVIIFSVHSLVETSIYSPVVLPLFLIIAGLSRLAKIDEKNL